MITLYDVGSRLRAHLLARHTVADVVRVGRFITSCSTYWQPQGSDLYRVEKVPGAGRGLVANRDLPLGTTVLVDNPFLSYPSTALISKICYSCLSLVQSSKAVERAGHIFCNPRCLEHAWQHFLRAEHAVQPNKFTQHCLEQNDLMPLLAARLVFARLVDPIKSPVIDDATRLCRASTRMFPEGQPPKKWLKAWELLEKSISAAPASDALSEREESHVWFWDALSAVHVNAFKVQYPTYQLDGGLYINFRALLSGSLGQVVCSDNGLACYRSGSLFNHSCAPNVLAHFPSKSGAIEFVTTRRVKLDESLCVAYVSSNKPVAKRREALRWAYGFDCQCQRCMEECALGELDAQEYWQ
mmetsp:Transcript_19083/g.53171  ORF Transcript_19083/g.53171 Transcript_19083/m.53171 type:complete len:356 (-) Transcript_19083:529-1596(-)